MNHAPLRDDIGSDHPSPRLRVDKSREGSDATNLALPAGPVGASLKQPCRPAAAVTVVDWSYAPGQSMDASVSRTTSGTRLGAPPTRRIAIIGGGTLARVCAGIEPILGATRRVEVVHSACSLEEIDDSGIQVDAAVLDFQVEDGRRTTAVISAVASRCPVLVIAASAWRDDMLAVIRAGASGYLTSSASSDTIIEAVETIAAGGFYLSASLTDVIDADAPRAASTAAQVALSRREREALLYISQGLTHVQTANRMGVSPATIDTFVKRIRRKLGPANKADLTREAIRLGYLDPASVDQRALSERSRDAADVCGDERRTHRAPPVAQLHLETIDARGAAGT